MSRKDYIKIAKAIRGNYIQENIIDNLCYVFKLDNLRFDEDKFRRACEIEKNRKGK